jgi:type IV secretory pathway VirB2 component (pilin)
VNLANIRDTVGGLVDDILVIVGIIGFPALFAVLYRAAVNKLEEKFASKDGTEKALIKLRSDIDGEMARLSTAAQSWLVDFRSRTAFHREVEHSGAGLVCAVHEVHGIAGAADAADGRSARTYEGPP